MRKIITALAIALVIAGCSGKDPGRESNATGATPSTTPTLEDDETSAAASFWVERALVTLEEDPTEVHFVELAVALRDSDQPDVDYPVAAELLDADLDWLADEMPKIADRYERLGGAIETHMPGADLLDD